MTDQTNAFSTTGAVPPKAESKTAMVTKLLTRARGATMDEMMTATTWQAHSVRAFLSGLMMQISTALDTEAELALKVCKDKEGADQDTCVADAKVKLQAKVKAAIEAMKK